MSQQLNQEQKLFDAAINGDLQGVADAAGNGADINGGGYSSPLAEAASKVRSPDSDFFKIVDFLISQGANVDGPDHTGWSPLMSAFNAKNVDFAWYLVTKGADLQFADNNDPTNTYDVGRVAANNGLLEEYQAMTSFSVNDEPLNPDLNNSLQASAGASAAASGDVEHYGDSF
jgi:ankyrin repeat protein